MTISADSTPGPKGQLGGEEAQEAIGAKGNAANKTAAMTSTMLPAKHSYIRCPITHIEIWAAAF